MLTPSALEKASVGFRSGYNDAQREMPNDPTHGGKHSTTIWWEQDYEDGYKAGLNDRKWSSK